MGLWNYFVANEMSDGETVIAGCIVDTKGEDQGNC